MAAGFVCGSCGRSDRPHHGRGLCGTCNRRENRKRKNGSPTSARAAGAGASITDTEAAVTSVKSADIVKPWELLGQHGITPDGWKETGAKANTWTAADGSQAHQLTVHAKRIVDASEFFTIPEPSTRKITTIKRALPKGKPYFFPMFPDPHCPLQERALCDAAEAWLAEFKPPWWACLGDEQDASAFSRHKKNPAFHFDAQVGIDETFAQLERWSIAAGGVEWYLIPGNHSYWLKSRLCEKMPQLVGLKQPRTGDEFLGLDMMLNLPSLNGRAIAAPGEYFDATMRPLPDLIAMHGNVTGPHGGAIKEIQNWEGASIVQGHDHKLSIVAITRRLPDGTEVQRYAISAGTMAMRELGYDPKRNVNQGFVIFVVWPDGRWHPEIAYYDPQTQSTTWRDWRYEGAAA